MNLNELLTLDNIFQAIKICVDIGLIWLLFYYLMIVIQKNLRTLQIFKGILIILVFRLGTKVFNLDGMGYIVDAIMSWGVVALIIIFQPEIRSMLEKIGHASIASSSYASISSNERESMIDELTKAITYLANNRVGAIISIEKTQSLQDYVEAATIIDAKITSELLLTIFYEGTTLHDGAVIIQGNRIACASAFYEPTKKELSPIYGARHRASIGLSEVSDALTIVVSEETGNVSFAIAGELEKIPLVNFKEELSKHLVAIDEEGDSNE